VYGCGLDVIYPPENRPLAEKISATGTCLSEFPLGLQPDRYTFPRRNRIISGLSLAAVVVEAAEKSGALITADYALEQGKEVFAVPGPIGSGKSSGCHRLIKEGARLFDNVEDVVGELEPLLKKTPTPSDLTDRHPPLEDLTPQERSLLTFIRDEPVFMDEVINHFGLPAESAASLMLSLELKGCIRQFPGKRYIRETGEL
jgi:DNA processing protein